ncbi:MAG: His/Gly/Thr/Pro-type tRNA ligase C-terminal domain-containing protein, partial [Planctomycetota bacterium]
DYCEKLRDELRTVTYHGRALEVELDARDIRGGEKVWSWIKKGIPIRLEVGPRDMAGDSVFMGRRDKGPKEKLGVPRAEFVSTVASILDEMQSGLLERARAHRAEHTRVIDSKEAFTEFFTPPAGAERTFHGGFAMSHFCGDTVLEAQIKDDLGVTVRCLPIEDEYDGPGTCPFTGQSSPQRAVWAKSY